MDLFLLDGRRAGNGSTVKEDQSVSFTFFLQKKNPSTPFTGGYRSPGTGYGLAAEG